MNRSPCGCDGCAILRPYKQALLALDASGAESDAWLQALARLNINLRAVAL